MSQETTPEKVAKNTPHPIEFCVRIRVRERPSGTELFAMIASVSLLLVTYVLIRILSSNNPNIHTDVAVAIIALPATLAAMAVFFIDAIGRSLFVSVAGMLLTFGTAIMAGTNIFFFAIQATGHQYFPGWWFASFAITVVLATASVGTFVMRWIHYSFSKTA
ncbi:hypothetical protein [Nocardia iowensis]|uniref:Uncharacterized protein n=1 Tax=Nocardia iowensis TaxID=204891 RepID=A0ABX8RU82_NOCIO|nr:hypothetical protein [Nocardia iowensis]QXN93188.1 hypothetical protein KV110_08850 [Nocardia iowensis]